MPKERKLREKLKVSFDSSDIFRFDPDLGGAKSSLTSWSCLNGHELVSRRRWSRGYLQKSSDSSDIYRFDPDLGGAKPSLTSWNSPRNCQLRNRKWRKFQTNSRSIPGHSIQLWGLSIQKVMHVFKLMLNKTQIQTAEDVTASFGCTLAFGQVAMERKVSRRPEGQARVRRTRSLRGRTCKNQAKSKEKMKLFVKKSGLSQERTVEIRVF